LSNNLKIGVAIVQWNHSKLTLKLIEQLVELDKAIKIVITDNGSQDEELSFLKKGLNQIKQHHMNKTIGVTILENRYNSGFSAGINLSIAKLLDTDCEWIWLLNNDIEVSDLDIDSLKNQLLALSPSIVGMPMLEQGGKAFSGSYRFNRWSSKFHEIDTIINATNIKQRDRYVSGANMLVHHSIFKEVGLLNQRTFLYFEELDFTKRASSLGYEQVLLEQNAVSHIGAASSKESSFERKRMYHETWSTLDYYFRHEKLLFLPCLFGRTFARQLTLLLSGRKHLIRSVSQATWDFLLGKNMDRKDPEVVGENTF